MLKMTNCACVHFQTFICDGRLIVRYPRLIAIKNINCPAALVFSRWVASFPQRSCANGVPSTNRARLRAKKRAATLAMRRRRTAPTPNVWKAASVPTDTSEMVGGANPPPRPLPYPAPPHSPTFDEKKAYCTDTQCVEGCICPDGYIRDGRWRRSPTPSAHLPRPSPLPDLPHFHPLPYPLTPYSTPLRVRVCSVYLSVGN